MKLQQGQRFWSLFWDLCLFSKRDFIYYYFFFKRKEPWNLTRDQI